MVGKVVVGVLQGRISRARWAAGQKYLVQQGSASSRPEPPVADAKGDQCGMEQHSGVWSSAASAVVWSLSQLYLESCVFHPSGSFR